ncbi:MAG: hypothetical protein KC592_18595 [Nitrospira sp.]|nr:hypothetical protein [Nitrospira sp.]HNP27601.1 hypothetical protein [Nitrospirales bacterium]
MRHAIEADHAGAVATLATKNHSVATRSSRDMGTNTFINLLMCLRIPMGEKSITKRPTITIHIQPLFPTGPYS